MTRGGSLVRKTVGLFGSILLVISPSIAVASDSCAVKGITSRWALSYCMTRFETDDELHPAVSDCFIKELEQKATKAPEEDCEANLAYKSAICSILIESEVLKESLTNCVASEEMIPSVVKNGVGSVI